MRSLLPVRGNLPGASKIALALLILGAFFLPAPFVMLSPGTPQNILGQAIKISGTQIYPTSGKLSVTSVMVTDPDSYLTGFDVLVVSACVQMPSLEAIDLIQKECGIPVTSAAVCTTYEMMKKLGIEAKSAIGGELLSGKY